MKVAVIIPVYNHAKFIAETLDSVLAQTRPADCILVIDDGSKDDSLDIVRTYSSRGVQSRGQENQNAFNTINTLVRWAKEEGCDWVNILNSDDRFLPKRLEACIHYAEAHPEKRVICGKLQVIDDQGQLMPSDAKRAKWFYGAQSFTEQPYKSIAELMGKANFIATTSNVFACTDYLLANPFRPYHFNHDYFFLAGAAWRDVIGLVPEVLMEYRVHGSNTIATKPEPLIREMLRMQLDLYRNYAAELSVSTAMRERFADYCRAQWDSISSFHAGMFQVALTQLAAEFSEEQLHRLTQILGGPEFESSPNRILAGAYDGKFPLSNTTLSNMVDDLKEEKKLLLEEREALQELQHYRLWLAKSKWVSFGHLLGINKKLLLNEGKTAIQKLSKLKIYCRDSKWLHIGEKLGFIRQLERFRK
jgi:glycosyltransferase involved in cell wall biosynthesis